MGAVLLLPAAASAAPIAGPCGYNAEDCSSNDLTILSLAATPAGSDPTCDDTSDTIDLEIETQLVVQSGSGPEAQARYDIGFYTVFDAVGNQCIRDVMEPGNTTPGVLDTDGDNCGDLSTTPLTHTSVFPGIPCSDDDANGFVDPFVICQSWGNNDSQLTNCTVNTVQTGTNPKCNCTSFDPGIPVPVCGDGVINQQSEECDDGNQVSGDGCSATCQLEICGDGEVTGGEGCDDGNTTACDGCSATCDVEACTNGVQECSEACDDGNQVDNDLCGNDCQVPVCGDGDVEGNEECDLGPSGEGSSQCCDAKTCLLIGTCGNGQLECDEVCDDGNQSNTDNCTNACENASCGDGFVQDGVEQCDDANQVDNDFCDNACQLPICGNGEVEGAEKCDDGNVVDGDGCNANCGVEVPTMGEYGLGALALLLIGAGFVAVRKGNLI